MFNVQKVMAKKRKKVDADKFLASPTMFGIQLVSNVHNQ